MCQQQKCPECGQYTVYYDAYFKAYCCSRFSCMYFKKLSEKEAALKELTKSRAEAAA